MIKYNSYEAYYYGERKETGTQSTNDRRKKETSSTSFLRSTIFRQLKIFRMLLRICLEAQSRK